MAEIIAKRYQDKLPEIKEKVKNAYITFQHNYDRYNEYMRFVLQTSLTSEETNLLTVMGKPCLQGNILEAYGSRLLGEFSKQEPDIAISADDQNVADPATIKFLEAHMRHVYNADEDCKNTRYSIYKDLLYGGFSVLKVMTDWAHPMSFDQVINIERAFDPTLCGWDTKARLAHKGDGDFCFENFPMHKDDFNDQFEGVNLDDVSFIRNFSGFNWSYASDNDEFILVCDWYEKKKKRMKIVQLVDGRVMPEKDYEQQVAQYQGFAQFPAVKGKPRFTELDTIVRYRAIENRVLEVTETDFTKFPLIFVDGNSAMIKTPKNGNIKQVTRPYFYHAKDAQRMKNFAMIAMMNEIENQVQHKFMVAKESLPKEEDWLAAYRDVQKASTLVYNAFDEKNPNKALPPPREIARVAMPQEIIQAFQGSDALIQGILGSYDAALGINNNELSGIAIVEAATQSNAAAMPYIVGCLQGFQRAAEVYIDLLPKYVKTPRTMPVVDKDGRRESVKINVEGAPSMFYDSNALNVVVKAGASFAIQKSRTLLMVKELMGMSPYMQEFISTTPGGLNFVLDNLEGHGVEQLKEMIDQYMQEMAERKQQEAQAAANEAQNNPALIKAKTEAEKLQFEKTKTQLDFTQRHQELLQEERKLQADIQMTKAENHVQLVKAQTERYVASLEAKRKERDMAHQHANMIATHHLAKKAQHHAEKNKVK